MHTVVAGTYDRFLFGFECSTSGRQEGSAVSLQRCFTHAAHKGPVKCIASSSPYIASGGADDLIHLYDLKAVILLQRNSKPQTDPSEKTIADLGFLMSPGSGAVTALAWHRLDADHYPTHLFSAAADGGISVWQAGGNWICYKTLHSHKKEVTSLAVHHSGRLAFSTARDESLKLWNMVKGKCVFTTDLPASADQVEFAVDGKQYALVIEQEVQIHSSETGGGSLASLSHPRRAHCMSYLSQETLATGAEDGFLRIWDQRAPTQPSLTLTKAHKSRVKGVSPLGEVTATAEPHLLASASSDGVVKLWDLRLLREAPPGGTTSLAEASTGARILCLASVDLSKDVKPVKQTLPEKQKQATQEPPAKSKIKHTGEAVQADLKKADNKRKPVPREVSGIAHDGVVEFPDDIEKKHLHKKRASKQTQSTKLQKQKKIK